MKKTLVVFVLLLSGCAAPYCAQAPRPVYNVIPQQNAGFAPPYPAFDMPKGSYTGKLPVISDDPHWTPGD